MERRLAGLLSYFLTEEQKNIRPREWRGDLRVSYVFLDRRNRRPRGWRGDLRVSYVFLDRRTVETVGFLPYEYALSPVAPVLLSKSMRIFRTGEL